MPIAYSQPEKQACDVSEMKEALRQALFEFFTTQREAELSINELKDFLNFYISTNASQAVVDCSGNGPHSGKAYHLLLAAAKKAKKSVPICNDGTEYGKCSSKMPKYCYGGKLEERCKICGCEENEQCDVSGKCVPIAAPSAKETGFAPEAPGKLKANHVKKPKITDIGPSSGSVGTKITLTGSGFTDDNAIFIRGQTVLRGILSLDGSSLEFALPDNTKCLPEQACPIKVTNLNGISNARPFRLTELVLAPPEEPPEQNATPPAPPSAPNITGISPSLGAVGTAVTLSGSGFTSTDNAINLAGVNNAVTGLSSADGFTLKFNVPQTPCEPLKACSVSVTNLRGSSNTAYFTLTQIAPQISIVQPNGGEKFTQGQSNSISWTGGKDAVQVALVEDIAESSSDPSSLIVGWINANALPDSSTAWDAKQICTLTGDSCWNAEPGSYKILAVSENELGTITISPDERGNFDVSDQPFTIAKPLNPTIALLAPNGNEKFIRGLNMSISWSATDIISKSVTINLLKAGTFNLRIAGNLSIPSDTGIFSILWTVPSYLAPATDYSIEILDSANSNVRDASDSSFSISTGAVAMLLAPNGGETWLQGFNGAVIWNSSSYFGTMAFNLLKSNANYKTLSASQPTWWYSFENPYLWPARYTLVNVTPDIPVGADYGIEIVNSYDPTVKDASDGQFNIITLPNPVAVRGRFIDRFTQQPLANVFLGGYDQYGKLPSTYTNSNGEFALNASTILARSIFGTWPKCHMSMGAGLFKSPTNVYVSYSPFNLPYRGNYLPVTSPEMNLGDIPFWPAVDIKLQSDIPVTLTVYYVDDLGNRGGGGGNVIHKTVHYLSNIMPLNLNVWVKLIDESGKVYYSPPIKLSLDYGCSPKVVSFFNGQFKWEPYYMTAGAYYYGTEGFPVNVSLYANGGIKPYTWSVIYGALPPGLSLDAAGRIYGIPTTAGTYLFTIKATDINGVSGVGESQIQIKTVSGTIPPSIQVLSPGSSEQIYQGGQTFLRWNTYNLLSKSVKINLLKGSSLYSTIFPNFSQSYHSGFFYYLWNVSKDFPVGTDYFMEISDATNPAVRDTNDLPFWMVKTPVGAAWSCCNGPGNIGRYLSFIYNVSRNPVQSFRLYEKKPTDSSFNLAATFANPASIVNCNSRISTPSWTLTNYCNTYYGEYWTAYRWGDNSSAMPVGTYYYQITAVDNSGVEGALFVTLKQVALEKVKTLSPSGQITNATPTFEWTIPQNWPSGYEKTFYVTVHDDLFRQIYFKYVSPTSPLEAYTIKTVYDGPRLEPGKKYIAHIYSIGTSIFDSTLLNRVSYMAMANATTTFWVNP